MDGKLSNLNDHKVIHIDGEFVFDLMIELDYCWDCALEAHIQRGGGLELQKWNYEIFEKEGRKQLVCKFGEYEGKQNICLKHLRMYLAELEKRSGSK